MSLQAESPSIFSFRPRFFDGMPTGNEAGIGDLSIFPFGFSTDASPHISMIKGRVNTFLMSDSLDDEDLGTCSSSESLRRCIPSDLLEAINRVISTDKLKDESEGDNLHLVKSKTVYEPELLRVKNSIPDCTFEEVPVPSMASDVAEKLQDCISLALRPYEPLHLDFWDSPVKSGEAWWANVEEGGAKEDFPLPVWQGDHASYHEQRIVLGTTVSEASFCFNLEETRFWGKILEGSMDTRRTTWS